MPSDGWSSVMTEWKLLSANWEKHGNMFSMKGKSFLTCFQFFPSILCILQTRWIFFFLNCSSSKTENVHVTHNYKELQDLPSSKVSTWLRHFCMFYRLKWFFTFWSVKSTHLIEITSNLFYYFIMPRRSWKLQLKRLTTTVFIG